MAKGIHPNSIKALEEATEKRRKPTGKRVNVFLTEEAIVSTDATKTGISRSELFERFARTYQIIQELQHRYHLTIRTPFDIGEPYFAGATPIGSTGWNGKPDFEASGSTLDETVRNLAELIRREESLSDRLFSKGFLD